MLNCISIVYHTYIYCKWLKNSSVEYLWHNCYTKNPITHKHFIIYWHISLLICHLTIIDINLKKKMYICKLLQSPRVEKLKTFGIRFLLKETFTFLQQWWCIKLIERGSKAVYTGTEKKKRREPNVFHKTTIIRNVTLASNQHITIKDHVTSNHKTSTNSGKFEFSKCKLTLKITNSVSIFFKRHINSWKIMPHWLTLTLKCKFWECSPGAMLGLFWM